MKKPIKALVITLCVVLGLAGAGFGGWYFLQNREQEPVNVFPFHYVGMTEYWGDSQESYGPVTTDRIQTVFLSGTQTVTEILVAPGDTVKKGDVLMTFDTTLTDIALERERLELERQKLHLDEAWERLYEINAMKPMVIPEYTPPATEPQLGSAITGDYQFSQDKAYDGSSPEKALILWIRDDKNVDAAVFEAARNWAETCQEANFVPTQPSTEPTEAPTTEATEAPATEATEAPTTEATEAPAAEATEVPTTESTAEPTTEPTTEPTPQPTPQPSQPTVDLTVDHFYMVMKVTSGNMSLGSNLVYQGMEVTKHNSGFTFRLYDASGLPDHIRPEEPSQPELPQIDMGSGFTAAQIAEMRAQQEKTIRDLQYQVKMAEGNYKIKQKEAASGNVLATIDGTVVSLLTEEEAREMNQPLIKISGGGGFYVQGSVSELQKDTLLPGQTVTVNDWNTGMVYEGTVQSIGDFPADTSYWNGMGNPNVSYYPFTVFLDESADLQEGSYVSVVYSMGSAEQGIYLENPFLRTENGESFVYIAGSDGKLEKRKVTTGKSLWGSYTQILDGLTENDLIAFPYGKQVKVGAPTLESDLSVLYG